MRQGLAEMGFNQCAPSDGAFYIYIDTSVLITDSVSVCDQITVHDCSATVTNPAASYL